MKIFLVTTEQSMFQSRMLFVQYYAQWFPCIPHIPPNCPYNHLLATVS